MNTQFDVLVVGGGVVGLTAAIAMQQQNLTVAVVDSGSMTIDLSQPDPRVYAINQSSQALFEKLGVWADIVKSRISPYRKMYVWDSQNGAQIDFDCRMIGESCLGNIIEESVIKAALLKQAKALDIQLLAKQSVTTINLEEDAVNISCKTSTYTAALLIVADGGNSKTRDCLGVTVTTWPYHQQAIVTTVEVEKPHDKTAWQVFNPDGPLALLPLESPHRCSIVWSTQPKKAQRLIEADEETFNQDLTFAFQAKLGACKVVDKRHQFPLIMRHANQYHGHRWIVMGDAAHTIHPLAGLGLNVGLADVNTWLNIVYKARNPIWSGRYLKAYQRARKNEVWKIIALMQGLKNLFINPLPAVRGIRGIGLRICNNLPPLKRFLIDQAGGKII